MRENERKQERVRRMLKASRPSFINAKRKVFQKQTKKKKLLTMSRLGAFIAKPPLQITKITRITITVGQIGKKYKK